MNDGPRPQVASPRDRLQLTRFDVLTDGAGTRFVVEGQAERFPDGMAVAISLRFDDRAVLEGQVAMIDAGRFRASFGPYRRALPLGTWGVSALFELRQQPALRLRRWKLDPAEREDLDRVERVLQVTRGTPAEIAAQREALEAHYRRVAVDTGELLDGALLAYASACRALFRAPGEPGYDQAAHLSHVREVGAARTADELERVQADLRFAHAGGHLRADAYAAWGEEEFLPGWLGSWSRDGAVREATLVPIEPRAARLAQELHAIVLTTFQQQADALFRAATLEPPPTLVTTPAGVTLPPLEAHQRGRRAFEQQRDELLQRLQAP
jgi:BMFP domain-containing protein YqiC